MAHPRRFRFGIQVRGAATVPAWLAKARAIESLGYASLMLPDHFHEQLGPISALTAAAMATRTLQLGVLVFANDFRHPVVLAKELATLDAVSGGRLCVGIGAGWARSDYDAAGMAYDPAGTRIERLAESLTVLKGLFADGPLTFDGRYYHISQLEGRPKPVQRPHPPFLIGGGGRRLLSLAGREADIVGINTAMTAGAAAAGWPSDRTAEATDQKVAWIREAAGRRFDDVELSMNCSLIAITDDRDRVAAENAARLEVGVDELLESPYALIGTVEEIAETLQRRRDRFGISYIMHPPEMTAQPTASLEAFAPIVARLAGR